jgi:hypothetical protein
VVKFKPYEWSEEELARRLAGIVAAGVVCESGGGPQQIPYKDINDTWKLDSGNNWFFHYGKDECDLTYRYASYHPPAFWDALKVVIDELLLRHLKERAKEYGVIT